MGLLITSDVTRWCWWCPWGNSKDVVEAAPTPSGGGDSGCRPRAVIPMPTEPIPRNIKDPMSFLAYRASPNCEDSYIRETEKSLKTRFAEHR